MNCVFKTLVLGLGILTLICRLQADEFVLSSSPVIARMPCSVAAADVNGDGSMDLISGNESANTIIILTNDGSGLLVSNRACAAGDYAESVLAVDLNGDKRADIISLSSGRLLILTNDGMGGFALATNFAIAASTSTSVVTPDVNGDGKVDLIYQGVSGSLIVSTNAGNGVFVPGPPLPGTGRSWYATALDVNGDGKVDILDVDGSTSGHYSYLRVLTNNGDGTFALSFSNALPTGWDWPGQIVTADLNGDGKAALIVPAYESGSGKTLLVLTNDGNEGFGSNAVYAVAQGPKSVMPADINGDGKPDLVTACIFNTIILTNTGNGTFGSNTLLDVREWNPFNPLAIADINGDGRLDIIGVNRSANTQVIFTNSLTFYPMLNVRNAEGRIVVSWPSQWTPWSGWGLQTNADLATTNWASFDGMVGDDGITKSITNSPVGNLFFRLSHPP